MEKITILGKDFAVQNVSLPCVSGAFFSKQTWSDTRIYSLVVSESDLVGKDFAYLKSHLADVQNSVGMRASSKHHIPVVDTDVRNAILGEMRKTADDFAKALEEQNDTFFAEYDKIFLSLFVGEKLPLCKVTLTAMDIAGVPDYPSIIDGKTTRATSRDVYDFESCIAKSAMSAAADILAAVDADSDEEEEE